MPVINRGDDYFAVVTYTGNGTSQTISGLRFQPDFVWIKGRSGATDHALYDAQRGVQKRLESNTTDAEVSSDNGVTAFNSDGFSIGSLAQVNTNGATYVAWCWKEGPTQGFDIVTYTGDGTNNRAINHSLGVTPAFIIVKDRTNTYNWDIYHQSLGISATLIFTTAATRNVSAFGTSAPTSTVFYTQNSYTNTNGANLVAYLFAAVAGFSAFGSYTGNGSADGPFVFCGFRPKFVMVKRTDSTSNWSIFDTARDSTNINDTYLAANTSGAEIQPEQGVDMLSNGFKLRSNGSVTNASGGTFIFMALAESPFKNSLAF
jgi:hypothetical protein